jgi:hypothetical protein
MLQGSESTTSIVSSTASAPSSLQQNTMTTTSSSLPQGTLRNSELSPTTRYQKSREVTTFAGSGSGSYTDGIGTAASFIHPLGVAVDSNGTVYVTDTMIGLPLFMKSKQVVKF